MLPSFSLSTSATVVWDTSCVVSLAVFPERSIDHDACPFDRVLSLARRGSQNPAPLAPSRPAGLLSASRGCAQKMSHPGPTPAGGRAPWPPAALGGAPRHGESSVRSC